jgi:hypothetical protein
MTDDERAASAKRTTLKLGILVVLKGGGLKGALNE